MFQLTPQHNRFIITEMIDTSQLLTSFTLEMISAKPETKRKQSLIKSWRKNLSKKD